jgi:hypothetical protein
MVLAATAASRSERVDGGVGAAGNRSGRRGLELPVISRKHHCDICKWMSHRS